MLSSCSKDELVGSASPAPAISIVSNNLLFGPSGGTGQLELSASGNVSYQLDASWCSATQSGNVITVTAQPNTDFNSRTALLTLRSGESTRQVPIQQQGMAFGAASVSSYHASMAGERAAFYVRHDLPVTVKTDADWLTATMKDDSLIVVVQPFESHFVRRATIEYESAGYTEKLVVSQYDRAEVLGTWYMGGTMSGASVGVRFTITDYEGQVCLNFYRMEKWVKEYIPLEFDEGLCQFVFRSATRIYESEDGSTDTYYFFSSDGAVATSNNVTMIANLDYNDEWHSYYALLDDEGKWGRGKLSGFLIRYASGLITTNVIQLNDPYIVRLGPVGIDY